MKPCRFCGFVGSGHVHSMRPVDMEYVAHLDKTANVATILHQPHDSMSFFKADSTMEFYAITAGSMDRAVDKARIMFAQNVRIVS